MSQSSITVTKTLITCLLFNMPIYYITRNSYLCTLYIQIKLFSLVRSQKSTWHTRLVFSYHFVIYIIHHLLQFVPWTLLIHRCHQNKTSKLGLLLIASNSDRIIILNNGATRESAQRAPSFLAPRQQRRHNSTSLTTFNNIRTYDVIVLRTCTLHSTLHHNGSRNRRNELNAN